MHLPPRNREAETDCRGTQPAAEVALFGGFSVHVQGRALALPTRKSAALLAILCFHEGRAVRREALMAELWPEGFEESARTSLRQALAMVRRMLESAGFSPHVISSDRQTIALNAAAFQTDVRAFEAFAGLANESAGDERKTNLELAVKRYA